MGPFETAEYVALRLVRRFVLKGRLLHSLESWLPYVRPNVSETDPSQAARFYVQTLRDLGHDPAGMRLLEIGCGRTNATGAAWNGLTGGDWIGCEPYAAFDPAANAKALQTLGDDRSDASRLRRVESLSALDAGTADVVGSYSVLEHVRDLPELLTQSRRLLKPGGLMIHRVDLRDHFFKYPYAFLTFSRETWDRWLDPGDLPRHRLDDITQAAQQAGLHCKILRRWEDGVAFVRQKPRLSPEFANYDPATVAVTEAELVMSEQQGPSR